MRILGTLAILACLACLVAKFLVSVSAKKLAQLLSEDRASYATARKRLLLIEQKLTDLSVQRKQLESKKATSKKIIAHLRKTYDSFVRRENEQGALQGGDAQAPPSEIGLP